MTQEELNKVLEKHKKWLNGERGGERADLRGADLRRADLGGANLYEADLGGAKLNNADLRRADLNGADLRLAKLNDADLGGANLYEADLRRANLSGADLKNANLDFSAFPLWCGGLDVHIDDRLAVQLLYHLVRNVKFSKNVSKELKDLLLTKEIISKANEFHWVLECGEIEV